jgi:hypothetical protein
MKRIIAYLVLPQIRQPTPMLLPLRDCCAMSCCVILCRDYVRMGLWPEPGLSDEELQLLPALSTTDEAAQQVSRDHEFAWRAGIRDHSR